MRSLVTYLVITLVALSIGWLIGYFSKTDDEPKIETIYVDKIKKEFIHDTVTVSTPVYVEKKSPDTAEKFMLDSSIDSLDSSLAGRVDATEEVVDEDIMTEKLIGSHDLQVEWITNDSIDVSEMLNRKASSFNEVITVEFWQSPLNLTGYELNRNKLKLFGFNPTESISLQVKDDKKELIMRTSSFELSLRKTNQFKSIEM